MAQQPGSSLQSLLADIDATLQESQTIRTKTPDLSSLLADIDSTLADDSTPPTVPALSTTMAPLAPMSSRARMQPGPGLMQPGAASMQPGPSVAQVQAAKRQATGATMARSHVPISPSAGEQRAGIGRPVVNLSGQALPSPPPPAPPAPFSPATPFERYAQDPAISLAKGVVGLPEAGIGLADAVVAAYLGAVDAAGPGDLGYEGGAFMRAAEAAGYQPALAKEILSRYYSDPQKQAFATVQDASGFLDKAMAALSNPSVIGHTALESAPSMMGGLGVARPLLKAAPALSPVTAGAIGEGAVAGGQTAEQIRHDSGGVLGPGQAGIAISSGALTGMLGFVGGKVAETLGVADVDTLLAAAALNPNARKGFTRAVLEVGFAAFNEGVLEELPQSVQEQVAQNLATGRPLHENVDDAAVLGAFAGAVMGGGAGAVSQLGRPPVPPPPPETVTPSQLAQQMRGPLEALGLSEAEMAGMTPAQAAARVDPAGQTAIGQTGQTGQDLPLEAPAAEDLLAQIDATLSVPTPEDMQPGDELPADVAAWPDDQIRMELLHAQGTLDQLTKKKGGMRASPEVLQQAEANVRHWQSILDARGVTLERTPEEMLAAVDAALAETPPARTGGRDRAPVRTLYTGPERRGADRISTPEQDAAYTRIREKLARGEELGSKELRAMGEQQSQLETSRETAAKERGETFPDPMADVEEDVEEEPERETKYKFASTQANLPPDAAKQISTLSAKIPDEDLAPEHGREEQPHITVKYGLHGDYVDEVRALLADEPPIRVTFGKTSHFPDVEDGTADAVKVDIDSDDLHRLNKKIADALPHTDTHPDYKPHATVAYVKPGLGKKYDGDTSIAGQSVTLDRLVFSDRNGEQVEIPLGGTAPTPESVLAAADAALADTPAAPRFAENIAEKADPITRKAYDAVMDATEVHIKASMGRGEWESMNDARRRTAAKNILGIQDSPQEKDSTFKVTRVTRDGDVVTIDYEVTMHVRNPKKRTTTASEMKFRVPKRSAPVTPKAEEKAPPPVAATPKAAAEMSDEELAAEILKEYEAEQAAAGSQPPAVEVKRGSQKSLPQDDPIGTRRQSGAWAATKIGANKWSLLKIANKGKGKTATSEGTVPNDSLMLKGMDVVAHAPEAAAPAPKAAASKKTAPPVQEKKPTPAAGPKVEVIESMGAAAARYTAGQQVTDQRSVDPMEWKIGHVASPAQEPGPKGDYLRVQWEGDETVTFVDARTINPGLGPAKAEQKATPAAADKPADAPSVWMNRSEIEEAVSRFDRHSVLGPASRFLQAFQQEVDSHSDGWPYWKAPGQAAGKLQGLIHGHLRAGMGAYPQLPTATVEQVQATMAPIKAFMTRHGTKAGMTLPSLDFGAQQAKPPDLPVTPKADSSEPMGRGEAMSTSANGIKVGERVIADEGMGTVHAFDGATRNVKIALEPNGELSKWIPVDRVRLAPLTAGGEHTTQFERDLDTVGGFKGWTPNGEEVRVTVDLEDTGIGKRWAVRVQVLSPVPTAARLESLHPQKNQAIADAEKIVLKRKIGPKAEKPAPPVELPGVPVKPKTPQVEPEWKYVLPSFVTAPHAKPSAPVVDTQRAELDARKAANKAKRDELAKKLAARHGTTLTAGIDPQDVVDMVGIVRTYIDDGVVEFKLAWLTFKEDYPPLAALLQRHFEIAWRRLRNEDRRVADLPEEAQNTTQETADGQDDTRRGDAVGARDEDAAGGDRDGGAAGVAGAQPADQTSTPSQPEGRRTGGQKRGQRGTRARAAVEGSGAPAPRSAGASSPAHVDTADSATDPEVAAGHARGQAPRHFVIDNAEVLTEGGWTKKLDDNMAALRLLKALRAENNRMATDAEQAVLARYIGWGHTNLAPVVDPRGVDHVTDPRHKLARQELDRLLTKAELSAMGDSTVNAHYSFNELPRAMWNLVERLGFKGGSILEPAIGTGHFFGTMPASIRTNTRTTLYGVDMEPIASAIARQLYQGAHIQTSPLQEARLPEHYFDLVISNVPFGRLPVFDPAFSGSEKQVMSRSLHNYFFGKALDLVRPGGLVVFVTSRYTMDSQSDVVRKYLDARADFLGAFRLPDTSFQSTAGTEVVTDVIVLRRKDPNVKGVAAQQWLYTETIQVVRDAKKATKGEFWAKDKVKFPVNQYFAKHPEMVLGTADGSGKMQRTRDAQYNVVGDLTPERLASAVAQFETGAYKPSKTPPRKVAKDAPADAKQGTLLIDKGKAYVFDKGTMKPLELKGKALDRAKYFVPLRDAYQQVLDAMVSRASDEALAAAQADLRKHYDRFVSALGHVNTRENARVINLDPNGARILALEDVEFIKETKGKPAVLQFKGLAPFFTKRTIQPVEEPTTAASAQDALVQSLAWKGQVDLPYMTQLTGKTAEQLTEELGAEVYRDPATKGWVTTEEYLSGDVVTKLAAAEAAALQDHTYRRNVEALNKVQPAPLTPEDFDAPFGATWVPITAFDKFFKSRGANSDLDIKLVNNAHRVQYYVTGWGRDDLMPPNLVYSEWLAEALNGKLPTVKRENPDGSTYVDTQATEQYRQSLKQLREEWSTWWRADAQVADQLTKLYNAQFNREAPRQFDGSKLIIPNSNPEIQLRPWQKNAVWRALQAGNTLLAHAVGAGKTFAMIATSGEMKRLGLARKPMIVVPNHLIEQWRRDYLLFYPGARVIVPAKADFEKKNRQRLIARIANNDWDAVILPMSQYVRVGVTLDTLRAFVEEQEAQLLAEGADSLDMTVEEFDQAVTEAADGDKRAKQRVMGRGVEESTKDIVRALIRLRTRMQKRLDQQAKDAPVEFEKLGVDALLIDEAHLFKNLYFSSRHNKIVGLRGSDSDRAMDMFLKARLINQASNYRNLMFATGTPVSNAISELYTMFRYLAQHTLDRFGMAGFDSWMSGYAEASPAMEKAAGTGYKERIRLREWSNLRELSKLFRRFTDVLTTDDLEQSGVLKLPKLKGGRPTVVALKPHPLMPKFMHELDDRIEALKTGRVDPKDDNHLLITTQAGLAAIDMRLVKPEAEDDPNGRIRTAARELAKRYTEHAATKGTQLVFLDVGVPPAKEMPPLPPSVVGGQAAAAPVQEEAAADDETDDEAKDDIVDEEAEFDEAMRDIAAAGHMRNLYEELKRVLVREHKIPADEIAFIQQAQTPGEQGRLFAAMNDGRVRIMIASTAKGGVGMNVQKRLVALHHLDVPWRPADMEQREGRIRRQGNTNEEIEVLRYVTEGSFDEYRWSLLAIKQGFIYKMLRGEVNKMDDVDPSQLDMEVAAALASGDPRTLKMLNIERDLKGLRARYTNWSRKRQAAQGEIDRTVEFLGRAHPRIEKLKAKLEELKAWHEKPTVTLTVKAGKQWGMDSIQRSEPRTYDWKDPEARKQFQADVEAVMKLDAAYVGADEMAMGTAGPFTLEYTRGTQAHNDEGVQFYTPAISVRLEKDPVGTSPGYSPHSKLQGTIPSYTRSLDAYFGVQRLASEIADSEKWTERYQQEVETNRKLLDAPFKQLAELEAKEAELFQLRAELGMERAESASDDKAVEIYARRLLSAADLGTGQDDLWEAVKKRDLESRVRERMTALQPAPEPAPAAADTDEDSDDDTPSGSVSSLPVSVPPRPIPMPPPKGSGLPVSANLRPSAIVNQIRQALGGVPVREKHFRQRARGIYKDDVESIRVKVANDLMTIFHEAGHGLDISILGIKRNDKRWKAELHALGVPTSRPSYTAGEVRREGAANFFREWLLDPSAVQAAAPNYFAEFTKQLATKPDLEQALHEARTNVQGYLGMSYPERLEARIDYTGKGPATGLRLAATDPKAALRHAATNLVDDLQPIKRAVDAMRDGAAVAFRQNAYVLARLARGAAGKAQAFLEWGVRARNGKFISGSLADALKPVSKNDETLKKFGNYLVALRVVELKDTKKRTLPVETGISLTEAIETIKVTKQRADFTAFEQARDAVYAYQDALLEYARQYGAMSDEQIAKIKKLNEFYIPFKRVMEEVEARMSGAMRIGNRTVPVKRIKGSGLDIVNPFESIIVNTHAIVDMVEKNRAMMALANQADRSKASSRLGGLEKIPAPQIPDTVNVMAILEAFAGQDPAIADFIQATGLTDRDLVTLFTPATFVTPGQTLVTVIRDGRREFYDVHNPELYEAITRIGANLKSSVLATFVEPFTRVLRAGATLTPHFIARNPARDALVAFLQSRYGFIPGYDTARGLIELVRGTEVAKQFFASGIDQTAMVGQDRQRIRETLGRLNRQDAKALLRYWPMHPLQFMQMVSSQLEMATRMGEFKLALEAGGVEQGVLKRLFGAKQFTINEETLTRAALAARDVTTDFSRGGRWTRELNRYSAFFNARVQGYVRIGETVARDPVGTLEKVAAMMLFSAILAWWNHDDDEYQELPAWEKRTYWHLRFHGADYFIRIPKPFEWGYAADLAEAAAHEVMGNAEHWKRLRPSDSDMGQTVVSVMPTVVLPILEVMANYSTFRDRNIVSPFDLDLPEEDQHNDFTSETAKALGRLMKWSPAKIEHLFYGYTAGMGRIAVIYIADPVLGKLGLLPAVKERAPRDRHDVPFVVKPLADVFHRDAAFSSQSVSIEAFYDAYTEMTGAEQAMRRAARVNDATRGRELAAEHQDLGRWGERADTRQRGVAGFTGDRANRLRAGKRRIDEIRDGIDEIYAASPEAMTPEQKRAALDRALEELVHTARLATGKAGLQGMPRHRLPVGR